MLPSPTRNAAVSPAGLEPPVFVTSSRRRARRLALATRGLAALVGLWFAALGLGGVGFARLPALHPTEVSRSIGRSGLAHDARFARRGGAARLAVAYRHRIRARDTAAACTGPRPSGRLGTPCRSVAV
jgi:hypothetical protein